MSLAHFTGASAFLIVCLMGAAWAAPTTPSSGSQSNIEPDSQANDELPEIKATTENQSSESAATTLGVELTSEFPEDVKCRSAWQMFLVSSDVHYASDSESQKRRKIFCANWIQEPNALYELGKVSHQWADLTFEEWKNKQRPILAPEFAEVKPTTDSTEEERRKKKEPSPIEELEKQHPAAFPPNLDVPENKTEATEVKSDWQYWFPPNMEQPGTYDAEPRIKRKLLKAELTEEEPSPPEVLEEQHPATFPPNMDVPEYKTEATEVKGDWPGTQQYWYPPNMEEPGTYLPQQPIKPNESTDESSTNFKLLGNETKVEEVNEQDMKSGFEEWLKQQLELDKFPPNMEEPGTYVPKPRTKSTSSEEKSTDEVRRIEDKEEPPLIKPSTDRSIELQESASSFDLNLLGNKTDVEEVDKQDMKSGFEEWLKQQLERDKFPPNMEEPGTYVPEPTTTLKPLEGEEEAELRRIKDKEEPPNMELSGNKTKETEDDLERIQCQAAWEKFLSDFGSKYENEAEKEKRRIIFCANWQRIQEHNAQYELGKVSHKKSINQWADLTFEEWKKLQESPFPPNTEEPGTYLLQPPIKPNELTDESSTNLKLLGNDTKVEEVNEQDMKSGFEEWLKQQLELDKFPPNMEEPGTYLAEPRNISKLLKEELTVEEPSPIEDPEEQHPATFPPNMNVPKNKTEATEVKGDWPGSQQNWYPPNMEQPGTYIAKPRNISKPNMELSENKTEASKVDLKRIQCQAAWEKFLSDFGSKYENEAEKEKRRNIFCANWQRIQEHNAQYELGTVSDKKSINQWADLTFEEWKNKQRPKITPEPTTDSTEVAQTRNKCQAAWEKFLTDFGSKYENEAETEKRRNIFCANWQRIQEHNAQYELGKVTYKKSISEWADLTFEEWKKLQEPSFPPNTEEPGTYLPQPPIKPNELTVESSPNLKLLGNETEVDEVNEQDMKSGFEEWLKQQLELDKFPPNMEEPGTYLAEPRNISKLLKEELTVEEPSPIEDPEEQHPATFPPNMNVPENKTEATEVKGDWPGSQQNWYPPNMEQPGTYIAKPRNISKPNMELSENKTEASKVDLKRIQCQVAWEKFLSDFGSKYENEAEKEKRRIIFCANWQRIQEHNAQYELGKVSHKKGINQWADLTFEEWKNKQRPRITPDLAKVEPTTDSTEVANLKLLGNETEADEVNEEDMKSRFEEWLKLQLELDKFPPNMEEPGTYLAEPRNISKLLKEELIVEEPSPIEDPKEQHPATFPPNMNVPENKTEATEVKGDWPGTQQNWYPPNMEEPGTYIAKPRNISKPNMELSGNKTKETEADLQRIQCQAAWEKFLSDFGSKYENEAEKEKRRIIFCANWQRIQEHNAQYELGKVSHKKSINQWADLTFEEWKNKQRPRITPEPTTDSTEVAQTRNKCQAAWEKFLTDFGSKYENEAEKEKRRNIFCANWQRIQEHNAQYELGKVTYKKSISEWADLTFEEWKKLQEPSFPPNTEEPGTYLPQPPIKPNELTVESSPNLKLLGNETEVDEVNEQDMKSGFEEWLKQQVELDKFPPNMEEPGTYLAEPRNISKLLKEELTVEEPSPIEEPEEQHPATFPPNMERK